MLWCKGLVRGVGVVLWCAWVVRGSVCDVRGLVLWCGGWYQFNLFPCAFPLSPFSSILLFVPLFIQLSAIPHALDKAHTLYISTFLRFCKFTENSREDKILRFQDYFVMVLLSGGGADAVVRGLVCGVRGWCCGARGWYRGVEVVPYSVGGGAVVWGVMLWCEGWCVVRGVVLWYKGLVCCIILPRSVWNL